MTRERLARAGARRPRGRAADRGGLADGGDEPDRDALALAALLSGYTIDQAGLGAAPRPLPDDRARSPAGGHGPTNAAMLPHTIGALRGARERPARSTPRSSRATSRAGAGAERLRDIGVDESRLEDCVQAAAKRPQLEAHAPARRRRRDPRALPGRLVSLDLLRDLMGKAAGRCAYAEARHVDVARRGARRSATGAVDDVDTTEAEGIGVRVRVGGGWGFAATRDVSAAPAPRRALARGARDRRGAARRGRRAADAGRPGARATGPRRARSTRSTSRSRTSSSCCFAAEAALRGDPRIVRTRGRAARACARAQGVRLDRGRRVHPGARRDAARGIAAHAADGGELQVRSYPSAHGGLVALAGCEHVLGARPRRARAARRRGGDRAADARPPCPAGATTLVLDGEQLALQVHESIGHALELDRILLGEASYAGTSWVAPGDLGSLRYGSEQLNDHAPTRPCPAALGSFGWDDEGVAASAHDADRGRRPARHAVEPRVRGGDRPRRAPAAARAPTASRASRSCA